MLPSGGVVMGPSVVVIVGVHEQSLGKLTTFVPSNSTFVVAGYCKLKKNYSDFLINLKSDS